MAIISNVFGWTCCAVIKIPVSASLGLSHSHMLSVVDFEVVPVLYTLIVVASQLCLCCRGSSSATQVIWLTTVITTHVISYIWVTDYYCEKCTIYTGILINAL